MVQATLNLGRFKVRVDFVVDADELSRSGEVINACL